MDEVLVDSDIFIDTLRGARGFLPGKRAVAYSSITRAELFAGRTTDEAIVRALLDPFREIPVDRKITEEAGRIRRKTLLALPDALIAATAMINSIPLVTRNRRHFGRLRGLRIVVPR